MPGSANRLVLDANLIGYWGLDEALETDVAVDATANALDLTVTSAVGTAPGRIGNSRQFDGLSSYATLSSALLRLTADFTFMGWAKLQSYNSSGSNLRCLVSCDGPTAGDNSLYSVSVGLNGALSYQHTSASGEVVVTTAAGTIRTKQFYFIAIRRVANGLSQDVEIYVDNVLKTPVSITVGGVPQSMPVPPPAANASATFNLGRSLKQADSAFWDGYIDEVSVHNVARPYHAYLIESYFRAALRAGTTKLSATNTVVAVSTSEMGAGARWWCFERDRDLYVVRESPFGNFGPETRLTTVGGGNSSLTRSPELVYDSANDILYVFFVSGNRIYKLTANSTDDPATINMPFTADTGTIIKSLENVDAGRLGEGGGSRHPLVSDFTYVNRDPVKLNFTDPATNNLGDGGGSALVPVLGVQTQPSIAFLTVGGVFGVVVGPLDAETSGYLVYRLDGGFATLIGSPTSMGFGAAWISVGTRSYGRGYFAVAVNNDGKPTTVMSPVIVDRFGTILQLDSPQVYFVGNDGDGADTAPFSEGGGQRYTQPTDFVYVNRSPVKFSFQDPATNNLGDGGGSAGSVTVGSTNRPVDAGKVLML